MPEPLLQFDRVTKEFDLYKNWFGKTSKRFRAVNEVTWQVEPGAALGIVGESGCGKSTMARMAVGLELPTSGEIRFAGKTLDKWLKEEALLLRQSVQMVFQDPSASLNPRQRIREILELQLQRLTDFRAEQRMQRMKEVLEQVQLPLVALDRYPHEFSGGQAQRISIARALISKPRLLLLDEPVSALDVSIRAQILSLLLELQKKYGLTYLFISHDLSVVKRFCDEIAVMYLGRIVEVANTSQLYMHPMHPYTKALIESIPSLDPDNKRISKRLTIEGDVPSPLNPPRGCHFHTRCPRRTSKCSESSPELMTINSGRSVACFLYD